MIDTVESKKILLVEDEVIVALSESAILERNGYSVVNVHSGEHAIQQVYKDTIDLILMDIDLGVDRMTGTEAARTILECHSLPIIFLTSHTERDIVQQVKNITRYGYVVKNSGEFVLLEAINMAFELFHNQCQLEESEARYRASFQTNPESVCISRLADGTYIDVNEGHLEMSGYCRADIIGRRSDDLGMWVHKEDRQKFVDELQAKGFVVNQEALFRRKDGSLGTGLISGRIFYHEGEARILSITRDISERKDMERHLKESELLYRTIVQTNFDAFMHIDGIGCIRDVNDASCFLTGYSREELTSMSVEDIDAVQSAEDVQTTFSIAIKNGGAVFNAVHRKKDGTLLPVSVSITHLPLQDRGEFVVFIREISG